MLVLSVNFFSYRQYVQKTISTRLQFSFEIYIFFNFGQPLDDFKHV